MRARFSPKYASSDPGLTVDRLRAFVAQGAVFQVRLVGVGRGFALLVYLKTGPVWLHTEKSQQRRIFGRADTAFRVVRDVGLKELTGVDLGEWSPE